MRLTGALLTIASVAIIAAHSVLAQVQPPSCMAEIMKRVAAFRVAEVEESRLSLQRAIGQPRKSTAHASMCRGQQRLIYLEDELIRYIQANSRPWCEIGASYAERVKAHYDHM
jgi:hypothetical protein